MKIYVNRRPVHGPWGGGSKILLAIIQECQNRGHEILLEEQHKSCDKVDAILCVDPRPVQGVNYRDILDLRSRSECPLIQRVGDIGTHGKPDLYEMVLKTTKLADAVIFPSEWVKNVIEFNGKFEIIKNGADKRFFENKKSTFDLGKKIRVITHHWSNNQAKGFDTYQQLSSFCESSNDFEFTYIGRAPIGNNFQTHLAPMDVEGLVKELPKHDIYLTASKWEAGANHVLEAMAIGLPILYHVDGGSIPEYCSSNGLSFENVEDVKRILLNRLYSNIIGCVNYDRTTECVAQEYVNVIERVCS